MHEVDIAVWLLPNLRPRSFRHTARRVGTRRQNARRRADKGKDTHASSGKQISNTFTQEEGDIHLGGIDAIVRLTLDQVRTDARRGLKTGMFVSGYRGSPSACSTPR